FLWYETLDAKLKELGFLQISENPCNYKCERDGKLIALYVDDNPIAAKIQSEIDAIIDLFDKAWGIKGLGKRSRFLGLNMFYDREKRQISVKQDDYVDSVLNWFNLTKANTREIPIDPKFILET
ncbi:hypothetical protein TSTA_107090, partial [Talaromyces stipitatus ATCC 10500]